MTEVHKVMRIGKTTVEITPSGDVEIVPGEIEIPRLPSSGDSGYAVERIPKERRCELAAMLLGLRFDMNCWPHDTKPEIYDRLRSVALRDLP